MYPTGELTRLSLKKAMVQARIAQHRGQCVDTGAELARPLETVDALLAKWRQISPVAKVVGPPIALLLFRKVAHRLRRITSFARMLPFVFQTARMVRDWR
jgi:hypothetical protein